MLLRRTSPLYAPLALGVGRVPRAFCKRLEGGWYPEWIEQPPPTEFECDVGRQLGRHEVCYRFRPSRGGPYSGALPAPRDGRGRGHWGGKGGGRGRGRIPLPGMPLPGMPSPRGSGRARMPLPGMPSPRGSGRARMPLPRGGRGGGRGRGHMPVPGMPPPSGSVSSLT